jgi:hypothetical protein
MKKIPRVSSSSKKMGHPKVAKPKSLAKGVQLSQQHAAPGDIAWIGPCNNGTRIVCYYDDNMDPKDCRNQPC